MPADCSSRDNRMLWSTVSKEFSFRAVQFEGVSAVPVQFRAVQFEGVSAVPVQVTLLLPGGLDAPSSVSLKVPAAGLGHQVHLLQPAPERPPAVVEVPVLRGQVRSGLGVALVGKLGPLVPVVPCTDSAEETLQRNL